MTIDDIRKNWTVRPGYWFAPHLFGYGATPVTWQGWAIVLGYAVAIKLIAPYLPDDLSRAIVAIALATPLVVLVYHKTDGGWRWRWGVEKR
ncbi:hypothetical protein [Sphingomonas sp. 28-62-11]|uniref:hypothetical protein n=1 Tax=Sphingomonas sp. 28-62-11 TaxID=1970432 RepID=UPI000BCF25C5|nr:MAG: hypothetical protein B7Y49_13085 [Sphingomonas sp. 28-62-11]